MHIFLYWLRKQDSISPLYSKVWVELIWPCGRVFKLSVGVVSNTKWAWIPARVSICGSKKKKTEKKRQTDWVSVLVGFCPCGRRNEMSSSDVDTSDALFVG